MRCTVLCLLSLTALLLVAVPLRAGEPDEPAPAADEARIQTLVDDLGSADFEVRERAQKELLALGERARPALERTMHQSDNMEARWRAEQILRRLDREGERPMGQPPQQEGTGRPDEGAPASRLDELERHMKELMERLGRPWPGLGSGPGGFGSPFGDFGTQGFTLRAPGLRLQGRVFASVLTEVVVVVEATGRSYTGHTLEEILAREPSLAESDGMAELKQKWLEFRQQHPGLLTLGGPTFRFRGSSNGLVVVQGPDGVTVRVTETGDDGKPTVHEYKAESLEKLKEEHPELKDRLERLHVSIDITPPLFFGRGSNGQRLPVPPAPDNAPSENDAPRAELGVRVQPVEPVLALHLGLEAGCGALVVAVLPGSRAESLGLERYDIVLTTAGGEAMPYDDLLDALRGAGRDDAPLKMEIIRRGQHMQLMR